MEYHHHEETNSSFHDAFNPTMHTKTETKPPHRGAITKHFTPTSRKKNMYRSYDTARATKDEKMRGQL